MQYIIAGIFIFCKLVAYTNCFELNLAYWLLKIGLYCNFYTFLYFKSKTDVYSLSFNFHHMLWYKNDFILENASHYKA